MRRAARIWIPFLPGAVFILYLYETEALGGLPALLAAAALLAFSSAMSWATHRGVSTAAQEAIRGLGPDVAPSSPAPLSPAAAAIRPTLVRLNRDWQEHAALTQQRLAAAEAIIAAVPDPLILVDAQRRIVRCNEAAIEFVGHDAQSHDLAAGLRNPALLAAVDAVLREDRKRSVEFVLSVPVERVLRAHVARIEGPALNGGTAIIRLYDVTELKRGEQLRADFIANAGHELKTPLTVLIGFIETLLGPARDDEVARDRFLGIMREQAQRMARLVGDLLSLSRIELNEHVVPTGRVHVDSVIAEVVRGLELRAAQREIRISVELPLELPEVLGAHDELVQIFQNLLDNAVKYARPQTRVTVGGGIGGPGRSLTYVSVTDQGDGIASEHIPRLTERFYRVDTARSRELGGTGLGLAIVKHILNRHRGRLEIASKVGVGSSFTVWLRSAPSDRLQASPAA
ncbi:MAG: PAS domain-containing protein [Alphaproteobacteria bacterium]|nr:PAS domain-containing protein [Alphaproteobacteria bacterium]